MAASDADADAGVGAGQAVPVELESLHANSAIGGDLYVSGGQAKPGQARNCGFIYIPIGVVVERSQEPVAVHLC